MSTASPASIPLVRLTLTPGLGPVLISRLLARFGSADAALAASETALAEIKGIGRAKAVAIARGLRESAALADDELAVAQRLGVRFIGIADPDYPPLLRQIPDPPPLLSVLGTLLAAGEPGTPDGVDGYAIGIVGSRECTPYGLEQADRFAAAVGSAGLTVISGGARGIDAAAHRAALRVRSVGSPARTLAVLGCGLANRYPPENRDLFDAIVESGAGALISELPLRTPPNAENFPARNRIISGLSLGVLVIEAGRRSGSLITARLAAEDHGRDVFAIPGRIDSPASEGTLTLIKAGGAALVTHPSDIIDELESRARHHFHGTHESRYTPPAPSLFSSGEGTANGDAAGVPAAPPPRAPAAPAQFSGLSPAAERILAALDSPRSIDALAAATGLDVVAIRTELTMLEISRRVERRGTLIARREARP